MGLAVGSGAMPSWRAVWASRSRRLWLALGATVAALTLGLGAVVPSVAERAVRTRAESLGLTVSVERSRVGFGRLWLQGVRLTDPLLPGSELRLDSLEVRPGLFRPTALDVYGGLVRIRGTEDALRARAKAWRRNAPEPATSVSGARQREISVEGIALDVRLEDGRRVDAWGLRAVRQSDGRAQLAADLVRAETERAGAELRALEMSLNRAKSGFALERFDGARAKLRLSLSRAEKAPSAKPATTDVGASGEGPERWLGVLRGLAELTAPNFRGSIVSVETEVRQGSESLRVGPSQLGLRRGADDVIEIELLPHPSQQATSTPLTLRARVPLHGRTAKIDVAGGPVSLETLGVREGDFGVVNVREAQLDLTAEIDAKLDTREVELKSQGRLENLRLRRPAVSPHDLKGIRLGWCVDGSLLLGQSKLVLRDAELRLGDVRTLFSGDIEADAARTRFALRVETPLAACGALMEAMPYGLAPLLDGIRMDGTFALKGSVEFDSRAPAKTGVELDVKNQCRVRTVPPAIAPRRFRAPWRREVKGADGLPVEIESGPGTPSWTNYEDISPHLETAVIVCEDGNFFGHHGIDYQAIQNSIRMNLEAGKFLRGGSTISMQLTKNLYLSRAKNLSRKLEEAVLTILLEQELSKHELIELYLNVIEFGPGIYGVRDAARYYFDEEPRRLSLGQALYLGSILPSPDTLHFQPDGRVSPGWGRYLQKLMHLAKRIRRISEDELAAGLAEEVAFRRPNPDAPRLESTDDEAPSDGATWDAASP